VTLGKWVVWRRPSDGRWVAHPEDLDSDDAWSVWGTFATHAEALAYAIEQAEAGR